jgi:hypothetical protein
VNTGIVAWFMENTVLTGNVLQLFILDAGMSSLILTNYGQKL